MPLDSQQLLERFNAKMPPTGILFGTKVLEVDQTAGRVRMSFQIDERFCNPRGTVQGGIVAALLDDASAFAGIVALGEPDSLRLWKSRRASLHLQCPAHFLPKGAA